MSNNKKHLIISIHGIGDAQPGETADAIMSGKKNISPISNESIWLPEKDSSGQFQSSIRRAQLNNGNDQIDTLVAEVHWSDLSAPAKTFLSTIKNLFLLAIGLGNIALRSFYKEKEELQGILKGPTILKGLSRMVGHVLKGPVLAGNLVLILITVLHAVFLSYFGSENNYEMTGFLTLVLLAMGASLIFTGSHWRRKKTYQTFNLWIVVFGACLVLATLFNLSPLGETYENLVKWSLLLLLGSEGSDINALNGLNWYGAYVLIILQLCWLIAWCVLVIMGFGTLIAVLSIRNSKDKSMDIKTVKRGVWLGYVATIMMLWLPTLFISTIWVAAAKLLPGELIPETLLKPGVKLMGLEWGFAILILVVMFFVTVRRNRMKDNSLVNSDIELPRVIISRPAAIILGTIPFVTVAVISFSFFNQSSELSHLLTKGQTIAVSAVSLLIFSASFFIKSLAQGADIGLDIAGYFKRNAKGENILRDKIQHRLKITIDALIKVERPTSITLVSHSQGTVFALKEVIMRISSESNDFCERLKLITMGSPFTHIYQHYFPGFEDSIDLGETIQWTNFYRVDDFVGTFVTGANNKQIGIGGHSGYWNDPTVTAKIFDSQN